MIVYWGFLILSLIVNQWFENDHYLIDYGYTVEKRATRGQALLFFVPVCFFCGLRSGVGDTGTYIWTFRGYPTNLADAVQNLPDIKDKGFYILSVLYKQFVSTDFHGWLFVIAFVSCYAMMKGFMNYSTEFGLSCFLFISTAQFVYLLNGMRQFIVISILFACSELLVERKYLKYAVVVLLLSTIHQSAIIFLPLLLFVNSKPWSFRMAIMVVGSVAIASVSGAASSLVEVTLDGSVYENYIDYIANEGAGANIIRLVLAALPVVWAFVERDTIEQEGTPVIWLSVNMSAVNLCIYFFAITLSGMAMARLAAYFDVYNLILLPWLVIHTRKQAKNMKLAMIGLYIVYFLYQMTVAWHMGYDSDILNLYV